MPSEDQRAELWRRSRALVRECIGDIMEAFEAADAHALKRPVVTLRQARDGGVVDLRLLDSVEFAANLRELVEPEHPILQRLDGLADGDRPVVVTIEGLGPWFCRLGIEQEPDDDGGDGGSAPESGGHQPEMQRRAFLLVGERDAEIVALFEQAERRGLLRPLVMIHVTQRGDTTLSLATIGEIAGRAPADETRARLEAAPENAKTILVIIDGLGQTVIYGGVGGTTGPGGGQA